jgi:hypothetical protein
MGTHELCQALFDHVARELPDEPEALLGLAALLTFHPQEVRLFITEAMVLLLRNGRAVPPSLSDEVSTWLIGTAPLPQVGGPESATMTG